MNRHSVRQSAVLARSVLLLLVLVLAACGSGSQVGVAPTPSATAALPAATATQPPSPTPSPSPRPPTPTLVPTASATGTAEPTRTNAPTETTAPTATEAATEAPTVTSAATTDTATAEPNPASPQGVAELGGKLLMPRGGDTWLYRPRTGETRLLLADTSDARWSPDGSEIAFVRADGLYLADGEGENERRIHEDSNLARPVWSPDGARIAFTRTQPGMHLRGDVLVWERNGGDVRQVARGVNPAWAPDSKRIAYVTEPAGQPRRNQLRLVSWEGQNDWPLVRDLPPDLPAIGVPGSGVTRANYEHIMEQPFWDAEGQYVYVASFVIYQALSDFFIWERADATNGGSTFLGELWGSRSHPSPDRRAALFEGSSARGDTWFVARALEGPDEEWRWAEVERGSLALAPAWAPDGTAVAYFACVLEPMPGACDLRLLTPDGAETLIPGVAGNVGELPPTPSLDWSRGE